MDDINATDITAVKVNPSGHVYAGEGSKVVIQIRSKKSSWIESGVKLGVFFNDDTKIPHENCRVLDHGECFQFEFLVQQPGNYNVSIKLNSEHVQNSPLLIVATVKPSSCHNRSENLQSCESILMKLMSKDEYLKKIKSQAQATVPKKKVQLEVSHSSPIQSQPSSGTTTPVKQDESQMPSDTSRQTPTVKMNTKVLTNVKSWKKVFGVANTGGKGVSGPIGFCQLSSVGRFVVAFSFEDKVKIFNSTDGKLVKELTFKFKRPSDMISLGEQGFFVRDGSGVMMFKNDGNYIKTVYDVKKKGAKCYGLAVNDQGQLATVVETNKKASLSIFDHDFSKFDESVDLEHIIGADADKSKCRFLTFCNGKYYITNLGANKVYIMEKVDGDYGGKIFGSAGSGPGQFHHPAGVVVDDVGNMMVADSRNNRLALFDKDMKWRNDVKVSPQYSVRRPSYIYLDKSKKQLELFVLCLHGKDGLIKYVAEY